MKEMLLGISWLGEGKVYERVLEMIFEAPIKYTYVVVSTRERKNNNIDLVIVHWAKCISWKVCISVH
jgi:hypothetical protein